MKYLASGIAVYLIGFVLGFGHCASSANMPHAKNPGQESEFKAVSGLLAGICWPLYWTWVAFYRQEVVK
jgi:hypothetical protein